VSLELTLHPFNNHRLANLCGKFDEHLHYIEKQLGIELLSRGNVFFIKGEKERVEQAKKVLSALYEETEANQALTPERVHLVLQQQDASALSPREVQTRFQKSTLWVGKEDVSVIKTRNVDVKPRTPTQHQYINRILRNDLNFGIGPAGTGKTYLAVACAVMALEQDFVRRVLLVRPAVEAGERLGFLPGDLSQKIDPYLRPLYDALYEMLGFERVVKLLERQAIEIAPLAYMRGRTLSDAFIILDESQNTTPEQMKMFLTRLGFSSTAVITGDVTQIDLPRGKESGLKHALKILHDIPDISFTHFRSSDVVRHPLVQKIVEAYDKQTKSRPTDI
jgi:phosphate starvation-inducible protein PhoH and related proteins